MLSLSVMLRATSPLAIEHTAPGLQDLVAQSGGYRVDGPNGRIGTISAVGIGAGPGGPDCLHVRSGLFIRRTVTVGIDQVASVDPIGRRVTVMTDTAR